MEHNMNTTIMTRTIQTTNRSGSFSAKADYTPTPDGKNVEISEWTFDTMGILPNGTEIRTLPIAEAQSEYKERKANGWT